MDSCELSITLDMAYELDCDPGYAPMLRLQTRADVLRKAGLTVLAGRVDDVLTWAGRCSFDIMHGALEGN